MFNFLDAGYPGQRRVKVAEMSKFGRPVSSLSLLMARFHFDLHLNTLMKL